MPEPYRKGGPVSRIPWRFIQVVVVVLLSFYLFIWLRRVLVAAPGLLSSCGA